MKVDIKNIKMPEKVSSFIENMDDKQRYCIFAGILLFIFLLDYFVLMRPQLGTLTKINPEIKILSEDIVKAKNDIQRLPHYQKEVEQLKVSVEEATRRIKSREEVPLILERISLLANQNSIKIDQIMPDTPAQEELLQDNDRTYFGLPILLDVRCGYHNFGRFLNAIESDEISFVIDSFTVSSRTDKNLHAVNLTLQTIVFEEAVKEN